MKRVFQKLTDADLQRNKFLYDEDQIVYSIENCPISLRMLVRTQTLSAYICAKYVIFGGNEEEYGDCSEDRWLDDGNVLHYQPHLTQVDLSAAHQFVQAEEQREKEERIRMFKEDRQ